MDGFLNAWKPRGITSFEVVRRVRRMARTSQIGHGGTLDPIAEGVLPILVGYTTRLAEVLEESAKSYIAQIELGVTTDTLDAEGRVLARREPSGIRQRDVEACLPTFTGRIHQRPPMYSALKRDGQRLYRLARRGQEIERDPRPVEIHHAALIGWNPPTMSLEVVCGRGTYIRVLAADIGEMLGVGATLTGLRRTRVGPFHAESASALDDLEAAFHNGRGDDLLLPPETLFPGWLAFHVAPFSLPRLLAGALLRPSDGWWDHIPLAPSDGPPFLPPPPLDRGIAFTPSGAFAALLVRTNENEAWRPRKVFIRAS